MPFQKLSSSLTGRILLEILIDVICGILLSLLLSMLNLWLGLATFEPQFTVSPSPALPQHDVGRGVRVVNAMRATLKSQLKSVGTVIVE